MDVEAGGSYQNNGPRLTDGSKVQAIQDDVNQLADVMKSNINKVLERGDRMDTLTERSELLSSQANEFRINSRNIRRKMWWQNIKLQIMLGLVGLFVVVIIIYSSTK